MLATALRHVNLTNVRAALLRLIPAGVVAGLLWYAFETGATWRGTMNGPTNTISLYLLAAGAILWLARRTVRGLPWARTALDMALPIWLASFALSSATNTDLLARSLLGLWFAGLYIALWYAFQDLLNTRTLRLETLADCLLVGAIPALVSALQEIGRVERVAGSLQNANIFGALLVLVIPLACARFLGAAGWWRVPYGLYALVAVATLFFSGSRGAWLGTVFAALVGAWLAWGRTRWFRRLMLLGLPGVIAVAVLLLFLRDDGFRLEMYQQAFDMLRAQPLFGRGLTTFKFYEPVGDMLRLHTHAHNLILQVAAELGTLGLLALGVTAFGTGRAAWRAWHKVGGASSAERITRAGAIAALAGFVAHHMTDFPVLNPAIALALVIVLGMAAAPLDDSRPAGSWRGLAVTGLIVVLLVAGFYSASLYPDAVLQVIGYGKP